MEAWRADRGDRLTYTGQVSDGDRLRVYYGDHRATPRPSAVFEFDAGNGVVPGAISVPIGATAAASFGSLKNAMNAAIPGVITTHGAGNATVFAEPVIQNGVLSVYIVEEVDSGNVIKPRTEQPDFFGLRDVARGYSWVEYENGERELYDLNADPWQLENRAGDPAYAALRAELAQRLQALLEEIAARD